MGEDVKYSLEIHHQVNKAHEGRLCSSVPLWVLQGSSGRLNHCCTCWSYSLSILFLFFSFGRQKHNIGPDRL